MHQLSEVKQALRKHPASLSAQSGQQNPSYARAWAPREPPAMHMLKDAIVSYSLVLNSVPPDRLKTRQQFNLAGSGLSVLLIVKSMDNTCASAINKENRRTSRDALLLAPSSIQRPFSQRVRWRPAITFKRVMSKYGEKAQESAALSLQLQAFSSQLSEHYCASWITRI